MNNRNGCFSSTNSNSCGCEGTDVLTPLPRNNRPGLSDLSYRIGTHASFLESMKARLSLADLSGDMTTEAQDRAKNLAKQLNGLTARDSSDPSIALLDAWAVVADVLTFYQERIANEGYLRTAKEERSIHELSRLVGFRQRTGVAASTVLAYTIDPNTKGEVVIPAGSRVQSVPGQNELPQTFESSEDLKAYAELNMLKPRMSKAQRKIDIFNPVAYLSGINTNLKQDDRVLIEVGSGAGKNQLYRVVKVVPDAEAKRTCVELYLDDISKIWEEYKKLHGRQIEVIKNNSSGKDINLEGQLTIDDKKKEISVTLKNVTLKNVTLKKGDMISLTIKNGIKKIGCRVKEDVVLGIAESKKVTLLPFEEVEIARFFAFRTKTAPFGHNAPLKPYGMSDDKVMRYVEWQIDNPTLNPDFPKYAEFIIKNKRVIEKDGDKKIMIDLENISKGYFNKVSWIKYADKNDQEGIPLIEGMAEIGEETKEYRFVSNKVVKIGEYISLQLKDSFGKKTIGGFEARELVTIDQVTPANFSVDKLSSFPEYTLIYENAIDSNENGEKEEIKITDSNGSPLKLSLIDVSVNKKMIRFTKEGTYSIERKIFDKSGKVLLSNCVKNIRGYRPPQPSFRTKIDKIDHGNRIVFVSFINTSTGKIDSFKWFFNGIKDEAAGFNAFTGYSINENRYDAQLNVTGPGGEKETDNIALNITFFTIEGELKKDRETNFSNKSTGAIQTQEWFFGDGKRSEDKDGKNTYTSSGKYTVTLLVTRSGGETEQYTEFVDITD